MDQRPSFFTDSTASIALLPAKMYFQSQIRSKRLGLSTLCEQVTTSMKIPIIMIGSEHPIHVDLG
jgi:hypothetical protein